MTVAEPNALPTVDQTLALCMLQSIATAICDRPEDIAPQRAARFGAVMSTLKELQPRDALEGMLAGMAGHPRLFDRGRGPRHVSRPGRASQGADQIGDRCARPG